jgi:hypothetical protein
MKLKSWLRASALVGIACVLSVGPVLRADDSAAGGKDGAEQGLLKHMVGTWDATVKMPGGGESKGTATYKLECGGRWLVGDFHSEFGGQAFQGRSLESYDAAKKKVVGVWVDSMASMPMNYEGTYDAEKKTLTTEADYPGMDGKMEHHTMVTQVKDDDSHVFTMYTGKNGGKNEMMSITYHRQK